MRGLYTEISLIGTGADGIRGKGRVRRFVYSRRMGANRKLRRQAKPASARVAKAPKPAREAGRGPVTHGQLEPEATRAALAAALDPIVTIDAYGVIQSASNSLRRVFGWAPSEVIGKNVRVLMPEPLKSAHDNYLERYRTTGKTGILNRARRFDAIRKDGRVIPVELSVSRADVPGQDSPLFVGIFRDLRDTAVEDPARTGSVSRLQEVVTEQTEALQTAHLRLRMADRLASIGTLAAGLGHDMNNVLLPVRARLNALRATHGSGGLSDASLEHVDEIRKSIAYLQQLADGLHFLAMDPEKSDRGLSRTNLQAWWAQTGALLAKSVPKHVRVEAEFPPALPEIAVAPHQLMQALLNLVVNAGEAIKSTAATPRKAGVVRVWAAPGEEANTVRVAVSDNGCGMTDEVKRRAFEMFYTTKSRGLGTGLGLALVRQVTDGAGGSVQVDSQVGKGTTVTMVFPAVPGGDRRGSGRPTATIAVADGRAASMIRHMIEACGIKVTSELHGSGDPAIFVFDPTSANLREAARWMARRPDGRIVLLGSPTSKKAAWLRLRPFTIDDASDLEAVRTAIAKAAQDI